jgi:ABC-type dipeptide/oligopeptide/nickel transport system permease subunit
MTAWLIIKDGVMVGLHLQLLDNYFIGYSVTWTGAVIGFFYGALSGAIIGWTIGKVYNRIAGLRFP